MNLLLNKHSATTKRSSFLFFIAIPCLFACNNTEDFEQLDTLLGKEWRLVALTRNGIDVTEACDLDDVLRFETISDFQYDIGALECLEEENIETETKKWSMRDDHSVIRLVFKFKMDGRAARGDFVEYWEIVHLTENILIMQDALAEGNNQIPVVREYEF